MKVVGEVRGEVDMRGWVAEGLACCGMRTWRFEPGMPTGQGDMLWVAREKDAIHRMGWIELKFEVDEVRTSQREFLRDITLAGGAAHVLAIRRSQLWLIRGDDVKIDCTIPWDRARVVSQPQAIWPWDLLKRELVWPDP